jgi:hypothetical protein
MPEATQKRASTNSRIRALFLAFPRVRMTKRKVRELAHLPEDTEVTARIRGIRNHPRRPMKIVCERRKVGPKVVYEYVFYPDKTELCVPGETLPMTAEKP